MKQQAYSKRTKRESAVGDWVYLKLQPYRQISLALRQSLKLCVKYYGPYQILARVGKVAYKLELPLNLPFILFSMSPFSRRKWETVNISSELPELQHYRLLQLVVKIVTATSVQLSSQLLRNSIIFQHSAHVKAFQYINTNIACFPLKLSSISKHFLLFFFLLHFSISPFYSYFSLVGATALTIVNTYIIQVFQ